MTELDAGMKEVLKRAVNELAAEDRRERIATAALQGLLSGDLSHLAQIGMKHGYTKLQSFVANEALVQADALIAELDKPRSP